MPQSSGGPSVLKILLLLGGGLVLLGILACAGVMYLGYREAEKMKAEKQADEQRWAAEDRAWKADLDRNVKPLDISGLPDAADGSPAADPVPQPAALKFDNAADSGRWVVLFRSADPAHWNTTTNTATSFAVPLRSAPEKMQYLRLRRCDNGESYIVPVPRHMLAVQAADDGDKPRWNGSNANEHGGRHLGILHGQKAAFRQGAGLIAVGMDGWDATTGSGFGHGHHIEGGGQKQAWNGLEITAIPLEIAVRAGELDDREQKQLLGPVRR
jgi:hypothetical protein